MSRSPSRVENSPYPAGTVPTDVWVLDWGSLASPAERVMANTLAGCLAQAGSPDFIFLSMGSAGSDVWYGLLRQEPGLGVHTELAGDLRSLVAKFAGLLAGFVMGDEPPDCEPTRNAVCIAGTLRALVASPSTCSIASDAGLKQLADARGMSPEDTHRSTRRHTSTRVLVHQRNCEFLSDYAVFAKTYSQATCDTLLANSSAEGLVWLDYDNYAGMKDLHWSSTGKPIVGPRRILGHANNTQAGMGPDTKSASELASLVNAGSTDPRVASSYSVVVVHAWSANVDTVVSVASQLSGSVRVVKPTELLRLMTRNIPH
eukprot:m51a1_g7699 hypothetical protein (316) ;mRNA; r:70705-72277